MYKSVDGNGVKYTQSKKRCCCCSRYGRTVLVCGALILLISGVVSAITNVFENWVKDKIRDGVKLEEGNYVYDVWLHPDYPSYMSYYMFDVSNAECVNDGGEPIVRQRGPYTYRIVYNNTVISRNNYSSSSLTYLQHKLLVFEKEHSCQDCDPTRDVITNVNIPFLTIVELIIKNIKMNDPKGLWLALKVINKIFVTLNLQSFQTRTVHELLWGYEDAKLNEALKIVIAAAKFRDPTFNMDIPKEYALQENKSTSFYTIDSGEDNVDNVGKILMWDDKSDLTCWSDKYANMINGTGDLLRKPFVAKDDILYVLVPPAYRSFKLIYDSILHVRGIRLYRFALDPEQFVSGDLDGNNKGFCVTGEEKKCLPTGLTDMSACEPSHVPIVGSLPHFYMANKSLLNTVSGLHPEKKLHGTFLDVEPHTGVTMQGDRRMQVNANVQKISGITAFENIATVYLPIFFSNKHARTSEADADHLKRNVLLPLRLSEAAPFVLIGLGGFLLFLAGICYFLLSYRRRHKKVGEKDEEKLPLIVSSTE